MLNDVSTVDDMLSHEISLGRIAGPFSEVPLLNFVLSPLRLVPKKDSLSFRLIHNLSFPWGHSVNSGIPRQFCTVAYEDYDFLVSLVADTGSGCFLAKADIESAFRIIPISPRDYHLLGFSFNNMYYYDRCLPMGSSVSCQVFEKLSCALQWILQKHFLVSTMSHILDDFIFISPSSLQCNMFLNSFLQLAISLGIPVKHAKTVHASTCVTVHGIEIDTQPMQARLPDSKLFAARDRVHSIARRRKVTLLELQSLIGTLNFACKVVTPGRPFLRRLIDLTMGVVRPHWHIRLTNEARLDLAAWSLFLDNFNGVSILLDSIRFPTEHLQLFTDASGIGFGAVMQSNWFQGSWPQSWHSINIAVKELYPIVVALEMWSVFIPNTRMLVFCDNEAVCYIVNNQTSKDRQLMSLVRRLTIALMRSNVLLRAKHVPGKLNVLADALSRFQDTRELRDQHGLALKASVIPPDLQPSPL